MVALNLAAFPSKQISLEVITEILNGGAEKVKEAGAVIGGGHTVEDQEIKYGLAVTGQVHPDRIWRNGAVRQGDVLVLTKPVGTGLVNGAVKQDGDASAVVTEAIRWMTTLNGVGIDHVRAADVSAVTDVTGFGVAGHAAELVEGSGTTMRIDVANVPRLDGIEAYFQPRLRTRSARETRVHVGDRVITAGLDEWTEELVYDPQTSGGLLIALRPDQADDLVRKLRDSGLEKAAIIGEVLPAEGDTLVRAV